MAEQKPGARARSFGCAAFMLLLGLSLLAGGAWLMQGWEQSGALQRTAAIALMVIGSAVMLPVIIMLIAMAVFRLIFAKLHKSVEDMKQQLSKSLEGASDAMKQPARQIIAMNKDLYDTIHEYRPATDADFEGLDQPYYEQMTSQLAAQGFRHLGDLVNATIEQKMANHTPIRVFAAADGTTQVGIFHLLPNGAGPMFRDRLLLIREAATELSDGTFLLTSNTQGLDLTTVPPKLRKEQCDLATPLADLLSRHQLRKSELFREATGLTCVAINTLEELLASERRQQVIKNEFRKGIGYADPEEIRRIGAAGNHEDVAGFLANTVDSERQKPQ